MATIPVVELDGNDVTDIIQHSTLTVKFRTVDLTLVDPSPIPEVGQLLTITEPEWTGGVDQIETSEYEDVLFVKVTCVVDGFFETFPAPFGISDTPNGSTTFGYRNLSIRQTWNEQAQEVETRGTVEVFEPGLRPGDMLPITSVNHGFSAEVFEIQDVTVTWLREDAPWHRIEFGTHKPVTLTSAIGQTNPPYVYEPAVVGLAQHVEHESANTEPGSLSTTTLPVAPPVGALLVAAFVMGHSSFDGATWPAGWTTVGTAVELDGSGTIIGGGKGILRYKISAGAADQSLVIDKGGSFYSYTVLSVFTGVTTLVDHALADNVGSGPPPVPSVGPVTATTDDQIVVGFAAIAGINNTITLSGAVFTELQNGQSGASPTTTFAYVQDVADDYTLTATSNTTGSEQGYYMGVLAVFGGATPVPPGQGQQVTEYPTGTTSGATITTNYPYYPNSLFVTVGGVAVVPAQTDPSAGEFTLPIDSTGLQVIVVYRVRSSTPTGSGNTYTPPTDPPTLPPIGSIDPDDVRDAGRWELAVVTGSPPDPLYADGDYLYIWEPGA